MQCENVQNQLDDLLDGQLGPEQEAELRAHIDGCEACQHAWHDVQLVSQQLRKLPAARPRPGYEKRMLDFLRQPDRQKAHPHMPIWFGAGFATAMFALFGVWFMLSNPALQSPDMPVMTVELPVMQTRKVDLVFNSPRSIQNASLRIELPAGTEIAGYPNRRSLEWNTSLQQGTNRLSLPLILKSSQGGTLMARITHQGKTRLFSVNLVGRPASSQSHNATMS